MDIYFFVLGGGNSLAYCNEEIGSGLLNNFPRLESTRGKI